MNLHPGISPEYLCELRNQLHYYPLPEQLPLAQAWPNSIHEEDMLSLLDDPPTLVHIESTPDGTHLIYTTITATRQQTEFTPEQLGRDRPEFTNNYNQFIGIKLIPRQCFDVISLYDSGLIEIKVDYLKGENTHIGSKEKQDRIKFLKDELNNIANQLMPSPIPWSPP